MEKHPGKLFYRLSRLAPGDALPLKRRPKAKVYANPLETQALPPFRQDGGPPSSGPWPTSGPSSPRWGPPSP